METIKSQAELALDLVTELVDRRELCDRYSEIPDADPDATDDDLLFIAFEDGSGISIDPASNRCRIVC